MKRFLLLCLVCAGACEYRPGPGRGPDPPARCKDGYGVREDKVRRYAPGATGFLHDATATLYRDGEGAYRATFSDFRWGPASVTPVDIATYERLEKKTR